MAQSYDPEVHSDLIVKLEHAKKVGFIQYRALERYLDKVEELKEMSEAEAKREAIDWVKKLLADRYEIFPINLTRNWDVSNMRLTLEWIRREIHKDQFNERYIPLVHIDTELMSALDFTIDLVEKAERPNDNGGNM